MFQQYKSPQSSKAGVNGIPQALQARTNQGTKARQSSIRSNACPTTELGKSGIQVSQIGIGAWSWGDRYWGYGVEYDDALVLDAYKACLDTGCTFLDTAEVYGFGLSEENVGNFMQQYPGGVVATKFAPLPWRFTSGQVVDACRASLKRLQMDKMTLYMQHWPGFLTQAPFNDAFLSGLLKCKDEGLTDTVGVSNFNIDRIKKATSVFGDNGKVLASNQIQYNILYRKPEKNGLIEACKENGVTVVAYSPLCQGALSGKYQPGQKPTGVRNRILTDQRLQEIAPVLEVVKAVGEERGKTMSQVAINWVVSKGALPLVGAKSRKQVEDISGSVGWSLTDGEVAEIDAASDKVGSALGAPFENW